MKVVKKKKILNPRTKNSRMYKTIMKVAKECRSVGPGSHEEAIMLEEAWLNNDITYIQAFKEVRRIRKYNKWTKEETAKHRRSR